MKTRVTISLDESVLKQAEEAAAEKGQSLSEWVSALIKRAMDYADARRRALRALDEGFNLGGKPLTRDEIYEERTRPRSKPPKG